MDLHHLRYFLAVAEELHFGRAARRLYMDQGALSAAVRRLENRLGTPLFLRTTRHVELSAAGLALVPAARRLLTAAAELEQAGTAPTPPSGPALRISLLAAGVGALTTPILRAHRSRYPEIGLHLIDADFDLVGITGDLVSGRVDVVLGPAPLVHDRIRETTLALDQRVALVPITHPLADADRVPVAALLDEPFVPLAPGETPEWDDHWTLREQRGADARRTPGPAPVGLNQIHYAVRHAALATGPASVARLLPTPGVRLVPVDGLAPEATRLSVFTRCGPGELARRFVETAVAVARASGTHAETP